MKRRRHGPSIFQVQKGKKVSGDLVLAGCTVNVRVFGTLSGNYVQQRATGRAGECKDSQAPSTETKFSPTLPPSPPSRTTQHLPGEEFHRLPPHPLLHHLPHWSSHLLLLLQPPQLAGVLALFHSIDSIPNHVSHHSIPCVHVQELVLVSDRVYLVKKLLNMYFAHRKAQYGKPRPCVIM